jgi:hypothetical protein
VPSQILRTGTDDLIQIDDLASDQGGVRQFSGPHCNVHIIGDEIRGAIGHQEFDSHARIATEKLRQRRAEMITYHDGRGVYAQVAARGRACGRDLRLSRFNRRKDFPRSLKIRCAIGGKRQASRCAIDKTNPEAVLQSRNEFRHCGWRKPYILGRRGKAATLDHPLKHSHLIGSIGHIREFIS